MPIPAPEVIAFIDEAGDYVLEGFNEAFPIFATCALTCTVEQYLKSAIPAMARIKYRFWGNECVVFHGAKIRLRKHPFNILKSPEVANAFMDEVSAAFGELEGVIIAMAIHKPRLYRRSIRREWRQRAEGLEGCQPMHQEKLVGQNGRLRAKDIPGPSKKLRATVSRSPSPTDNAGPLGK